jgi:hypothetical protein
LYEGAQITDTSIHRQLTCENSQYPLLPSYFTISASWPHSSKRWRICLKRFNTYSTTCWVWKAETFRIDSCISGWSRIMKEEELASLKAHLAELPATALRQLKRYILQERRRREAEGTAKAKGSVPKEEAPALLQTAPRADVGKCKANELHSSDSVGSMEPATRRQAPGPMPGAGSAPLPTQAKRAPH